jgi:hypothetical protein
VKLRGVSLGVGGFGYQFMIMYGLWLGQETCVKIGGRCDRIYDN